MYEIVNVQYTGTYNNGGTSIPAVLGEFRASAAADLPAQNVDCHIICGCDGLDIATGDRYIWNGTAWILQPSANAWENVYTKAEIDSTITEIYDIIAYYHAILVSDTGEITFYSFGGNVGTWAIYGNGQQTGTPTPDAPIMPTFCGTLDGTDWKIPITCAGQTVPVYLGQVSTVRRVSRKVFNGTEPWSKAGSGVSTFYYTNVQTPLQNSRALCSHFETALFASSTYIRVYDKGEAFQDTTEFKTYLQQQYANGTPVTVWYVLATEQTGIVNEPLCKIGDYADELHSEDTSVTIPTVRGQNTLTVDTTLKPSKIEISGER